MTWRRDLVVRGRCVQQRCCSRYQTTPKRLRATREATEVEAGVPTDQVPLRRNRDFNLLWFGQVVSDLGGRVSAIAFPLLVLATTGSPAKAGLVAAAGTLPLLVLTLPAGGLADRWNRKRLMIVADSVRCVALTSIVVTLAIGLLSFPLIVVVAFVEGAGFVFFSVGERAALPSVVLDHQLEAALARNQARDYAATLGGAPLGGALYALGRLVPFVFDASSYLISVLSLLLIRGSFTNDVDEPRPKQARRLLHELRGGLEWFWHQSFIRTTALLATGTDFVLNALYLVVIVVARQRGASPELIGAMFIFLGGGGILGSFAAAWLARWLPIRPIVIGTPCIVAALTPLLVVLPGRVTPGIIYGAMFFMFPTWNATVGSFRLRLTPNEMQGRVASISTLFSLGPAFVASLTAGFLLQYAGTTPTVLLLCGVVSIVTVAALVSPTMRRRPRDAADAPP
jgi:MFS family permease